MKVIYWSQTGNTQKMAELIAKGIEEGGKKAELVELDNISIYDLNDEKVSGLYIPLYRRFIKEKREG